MAFPTAYFVAAAVPRLSSSLPFPQGSGFLACYLAAAFGKVEFVIAGRLLGETGVEEHG